MMKTTGKILLIATNGITHSMTQIDKIEATMARKRAEDLALRVIDKDKDYQRSLASATMGMKVFDIIEMIDHHSDPVLVWVYTAVTTKDLRKGEKVIAMVLWPSPTCQGIQTTPTGSVCRKLGVRFEELTFDNGKLFDRDGQNFILTLQDGGYPY